MFDRLLRFLKFLKIIFPIFAKHGVSFSRTSLAICKNSEIKCIKYFINKRFHAFKHLFLRLILRDNSIELSLYLVMLINKYSYGLFLIYFILTSDLTDTIFSVFYSILISGLTLINTFTALSLFYLLLSPFCIFYYFLSTSHLYVVIISWLIKSFVFYRYFNPFLLVLNQCIFVFFSLLVLGKFLLHHFSDL